MSADSIPARMAELNKTLEQLNRLYEMVADAGQCISATGTASEARCVASEIRRLSNYPLPRPSEPPSPIETRQSPLP